MSYGEVASLHSQIRSSRIHLLVEGVEGGLDLALVQTSAYLHDLSLVVELLLQAIF